MISKWSHSDDDAFLPDNRKEVKQQRKIASSTDRSKFKKTDREKQIVEKFKKAPLHTSHGYLRGRVVSIISQGINVSYEGKTILCTLRGVFKRDRDRIKNLITVGDYVHFEPAQSPHDEGTIFHIEERRSILSRSDHLTRRKEQLLAANIDQVLITVSVGVPTLKPALVDRYLIAAEKGNMSAVIIVNKVDLLEKMNEEDKAFYELFISTYQQLNIPFVILSAKTGTGIENLMAVMKDKTSVFSGQSGTGKSSLINAITHLNLPIAGIVEKTQKGAHTTTSAQLIPLSFGGWCIDTPGIRSFGIWRLDRNEVEGYFPEVLEHSLNCKYPSCRHIQEPGCAVIQAVEKGEISPLRYDSYVRLIEQEEWDIPY